MTRFLWFWFVLQTPTTPSDSFCNSDVTIATSTSLEDFEFPASLENPSLIRNYAKNNFNRAEFAHGTSNYLIIDDNYADFQNTVTCLLREKNLKVDGHYLILPKIQDTSEMKKYFQLLWSYEVYNVIIDANGSYHTWYPYENCGRLEIRKTDLSRGFSDKIPKRLNCPIRVTWSQTDMDLHEPMNKSDLLLYANVLAISMGTEFVFVKHDLSAEQSLMVKRQTFDTGEFMRANNLTMIVRGVLLFFEVEQKATVERTHFVHHVEFVLLMPPRRVKPKWREFVKCDATTLLLTLLTVLIWGILTSQFSRISLGHSVFFAVQLLVQLSVSTDPRKLKVRLFLAMMLFSMLLNIYYLNTLSSVFTQPNLEPKIRTVNDFARSDMALRCPRRILENHLFPTQDEETRTLLRGKHTENLLGYSHEIRNFIDNGDAAFITVTMNFMQHIKNPEALEKVAFSTMYNYFFIPVRCHLKEKINYHLREIEERGLRHKFEYMARMNVPKYLFREHEDVVILSVSDLRGVFLIWIFGCVVSTLAFLAELMQEGKLRIFKSEKKD